MLEWCIPNLGLSPKCFFLSFLSSFWPIEQPCFWKIQADTLILRVFSITMLFWDGDYNAYTSTMNSLFENLKEKLDVHGLL
jgi:hypothetical protein